MYKYIKKLHCLQQLNEIMKFSQLLIQGWVDYFADLSGFFLGTSITAYEREVKGETMSLLYSPSLNDSQELFAERRGLHALLHAALTSENQELAA